MHGSGGYYQIRQLREPTESIWGVRKDYIILFVAYLQPLAHIQTVDSCLCKAHGAQSPADELAVSSVNLHNINIFRSPGCKFIAYGPCAPEEVKQ